MFGFVQFVAKAFMRSGETRPPNIAGTPSSLIAIRGADWIKAVWHSAPEPDAGAGLGHDRCERGLADLKRIAPQVIAVQFDEVEGDCPEDASRK